MVCARRRFGRDFAVLSRLAFWGTGAVGEEIHAKTPNRQDSTSASVPIHFSKQSKKMSEKEQQEIYLVSNPAAGAEATDELVQIVKNQLNNHRRKITAEYATKSPLDGVRIGKELYKRVTAGRPSNEARETVIILFGGDGTTYELLNGLYGDSAQNNTADTETVPSIKLVIAPTGTANALYAGMYPPESSARHTSAPHQASPGPHDWRLLAFNRFLSNDSSTPLFNLTLSASALELADGSRKSVLTHIVASHALHAAILADSEALRSEHPGVERFKMAAMQNIDKWIDGTLTLLPPTRDEDTTVQVFNPEKNSFDTLPSGNLKLQGPIFYMVCTPTDRFEPTFVPAPFAFPSDGSDNSHSGLERPSDVLDIVLIRPSLDPLISKTLSADKTTSWEGQDTSEARKLFAEKRAVPITQAMYQEGKHVYLRYPGQDEASDKDLSPENKGAPVIEYYRVGGYAWQPSGTSTRGGLTCLDGDVFDTKSVYTRTIGLLNGKIRAYI
ncbi:unnamed protein product [Sympodiomycopsis kandeliae]